MLKCVVVTFPDLPERAQTWRETHGSNGSAHTAKIACLREIGTTLRERIQGITVIEFPPSSSIGVRIPPEKMDAFSAWCQEMNVNGNLSDLGTMDDPPSTNGHATL